VGEIKYKMNVATVLIVKGEFQKNSSSCRKTQNLKPEKSAAKAKLLRLN
jgi:hypothetical protein